MHPAAGPGRDEERDRSIYYAYRTVPRLLVIEVMNLRVPASRFRVKGRKESIPP